MISRKMLKIHKWWSSHYVAMMAVIYYVLAISPAPPTVVTFLGTLGLFTFASIGIASFGQLLNDATDVRQDVRTGAHNLVASKGLARTVALFLAVLVVGIVPWFWLPTTPAIVALIAAEYALFILYSVPPVRLKDRGIWGPVADALYGYVVPQVVAALVFAKLGGGMPPNGFMAPLVVWCLLFGLDGILQHQLLDETRDRDEGIRTFVVQNGWARSIDITFAVVVAAIPAFLALLAVQGRTNPLVPAGYAMYLVFTLSSWAHRGVWRSVRIDRLPRVDGLHLLSRRMLADFLWLWHPLLVLAPLAIRSPEYLAVAAIHLAVFPTGVWNVVLWHWPEWRRLTRAA